MHTEQPYILKLTIFALFAWVFMYTTAISEERYLCVADKTTGFLYDETTKEWVSYDFITKYKYIISPNLEDKKLWLFGESQDFAFMVTEVGKDLPLTLCKSGANDVGILFCWAPHVEFNINIKSGRYLKTHSYGYYNQDESNDDNSSNPHMEIGKCSPF